MDRLNDKPRVFGVGLSRTGTSSLAEALRLLGWKAVHWPRSMREICNAQAATDITVAVRFRELSRAYPSSKFILTVRDVEGWMRSLRAYFDLGQYKYVRRVSSEVQYAFVLGAERKLYGGALGIMTWTDDELRTRYARHNKDVVDWFTKQPWRLLVLDLREGWGPLCKFLGVPVPEGKLFPHWNRIEEKPR